VLTTVLVSPGNRSGIFKELVGISKDKLDIFNRYLFSISFALGAGKQGWLHGVQPILGCMYQD
jgi:hypothetical protein